MDDMSLALSPPSFVKKRGNQFTPSPPPTGGSLAMHDLLDAIHAAIAPNASADARAAGADACRTILTALDAAPGKPMNATATAQASPIATIVAGLRGVPPDQLLDLAITKLRAALPPDAEVAPVQPIRFHLVGRPGGTP